MDSRFEEWNEEVESQDAAALAALELAGPVFRDARAKPSADFTALGFPRAELSVDTMTRGIERYAALLLTKETSSSPLMSGMLMSVRIRS